MTMPALGQAILRWYAAKNLRQRLIAINMVMISVVLALIGVALVVHEYLSYRGDVETELRQQAQLIAKLGEPLLASGNRRGLSDALAGVSTRAGLRRAAIVGNGATIADYRAPGAGAFVADDDELRSAGVRAGLLAISVGVPFTLPPRTGIVVVEASLVPLFRHLGGYALVFVLVGLAAVLIATHLTDLLVAATSRPLMQLVELMERVSDQKDFSVRARVHGDDEIGALAQGFNRMLHRIEKREKELRRELSERRSVERRLTKLAHFDTLTRLPNRNFFNRRLAEVLAAPAEDRIVALLFLDLDNFKIVNDTLGHQLGDALLVEVARRLRACMRSEDCVCRLGGDEFTIIVENVATIEQVAVIAQKVVSVLADPIGLGDNEFYVTCSIGVSVFPRDGTDAETLVKNGDTAMYHAKELGRNNFQFFTREMTERARRRLTLESALRQALERGEFVLCYQPQVDLRTGEIVGAEALLRWQRPGVGLVGPAEVIPVAEETGLIVAIGEWILWTACMQASEWQREGHDIRVSVNISARQFRESDFLRVIAHVLDETQLDPSGLELELTESILMDDVEGAIAKAQDLRAMGVALSIDDFGTGYSSISYLQRFPFSQLKIDRSFVKDIPSSADNIEITKAIIAMARGLGVEVVAEGVESEAQIDFLAQAGCDRAQGYLIAKALSVQDLTARLGQRRDAKTTVHDATTAVPLAAS